VITARSASAEAAAVEETSPAPGTPPSWFNALQTKQQRAAAKLAAAGNASSQNADDDQPVTPTERDEFADDTAPPLLRSGSDAPPPPPPLERDESRLSIFGSLSKSTSKPVLVPQFSAVVNTTSATGAGSSKAKPSSPPVTADKLAGGVGIGGSAGALSAATSSSRLSAREREAAAAAPAVESDQVLLLLVMAITHI